MDAPQNNLNQISTPPTKSTIEELFDNLSPIRSLESLPTFNTIGFVPPVFTTPRPHATYRREGLQYDALLSQDIENKQFTRPQESRMGMDLQRMCKNKGENERYWQKVVSNIEPEMLVFDDSNMDNSTDETHANLQHQHREVEVRRQYSNFEIPNVLKVTRDYSRFVLPNGDLHAIVMSSRNLQDRGQEDNTIVMSSRNQEDNSIVMSSRNQEDRGQENRHQDGHKSLNLEELIPKKKRHKSEEGGESKSCKRCNCKKSKCLKLYCECFAAGVYCTEPCSCVECFNKYIHEGIVIATRKQIETRNPLAFAPKVIRTSQSMVQTTHDPRKTPASARHKRGCNCKKSNCLKKYCECYQSGVGCSVNCRCEGCKNSFGRKHDTSGCFLFGNENEQDKENEMSNQVVKHETSSSLLRQPLGELPNNNGVNPPQLSLPFKDGSSSRQFNSLSESTESMIERIREKRSEDMLAITASHVETADSRSSPWTNGGDSKLKLSIPPFPSLNFR